MNAVEAIREQESALRSIIRAATDVLNQIGTDGLDDDVRECEEARKACLHRLDRAADTVLGGAVRTVRDVGGIAADLAADLFGAPSPAPAPPPEPAPDRRDDHVEPAPESPQAVADRMAETETVAEELEHWATGHGIVETVGESPMPPRIAAIAAACAREVEADAAVPAAATTTHKTNGRRKKQS